MELDFLIKGRDEASAVFDKVTGKVNTLLDKYPNLTRNLVAGASAAYALSTAFSVVSEKTKELIELASQKEQADLRLAQAMKTNLLYTNQNFEGMKAYADQIKNTYAVEDEEVKGMMARLAPFGMTVEEIKKAIPVILDFAKAKDIDTASAANFIGKAYVGHIEMLQRMGIVLDADQVKTKGLDYILGEFNKRFGGASQADIGSYSRQVKEMGIQWDDMKKKMGAPLMTSAKWTMEKIESIWSLADKVLQKMAGYKDDSNSSTSDKEGAHVSTDFGTSIEWQKNQSKLDAQQDLQNKQEQKKRDHEGTMVAIANIGKALELASLDGWEKQKAELEKKFDDEEKKYREGGNKGLEEFNEKKAAIIEKEHQKWLTQAKDTAKAALDAWREEDEIGADEQEKAYEKVGKKYNEISEQYKKLGMDMTEVNTELEKELSEIQKKYDEINWQKGIDAFNKIVAARVASDQKASGLRDSINGMANTDPTGEAARQHELTQEKLKFDQLNSMQNRSAQQIEADWEAHKAAMARINKKYDDIMAQDDKSFFDQILAETGIMDAKLVAAQTKLTAEHYDSEIDRLNKQDLTGEDARIRDEEVARLQEKKMEDIDALKTKYQDLTDTIWKFKDAEDAANGVPLTAHPAGVGSPSGAPTAKSVTGGPSGDWSKDIDNYYGTPGAEWPQAEGGDYLVTKPTRFLAGEAGPERATFTPIGKAGKGGGGGDMHLHFPRALIVTQESVRELVSILEPVRREMAGKGKI
jgi:hypothetical protein